MSGRRDWKDTRRNRGAEERAADTRRRRSQEHQRAKVDRTARDEGIDEHDMVIGEGPVLRKLPQPKELSGLLDQVVAQRGWTERLRGVQLDGRWATIVGPELAERTRPGRLVNGVLQVVVASPQWATQVQYMTEQLRGRVTAETGLIVHKVVVVVGDVTPPSDG